SAVLEEAQDRRVADYPVCRHAAAPGTGPHPALARGTREPEAARCGLRQVSVPAPTPRFGRAARVRAGWTAPDYVAAGILCLRGRVGRSAAPLSWFARGQRRRDYARRRKRAGKVRCGPQ